VTISAAENRAHSSTSLKPQPTRVKAAKGFSTLHSNDHTTAFGVYVFFNDVKRKSIVVVGFSMCIPIDHTVDRQ
jgi:hypothetical protein